MITNPSSGVTVNAGRRRSPSWRNAIVPKVRWFNSTLLGLLLSSCEINHYEAHSSATRYVKEDSYALAGSNHSNRSDGSGRTWDGQKSFSDFTSAVGLLAGAYFMNDYRKAQEISSQLAAKGATNVQIAQIKAEAVATAAAQRGANLSTGAAAGAFKKEGAVFPTN